MPHIPPRVVKWASITVNSTVVAAALALAIAGHKNGHPGAIAVGLIISTAASWMLGRQIREHKDKR